MSGGKSYATSFAAEREALERAEAARRERERREATLRAAKEAAQRALASLRGLVDEANLARSLYVPEEVDSQNPAAYAALAERARLAEVSARAALREREASLGQLADVAAVGRSGRRMFDAASGPAPTVDNLPAVSPGIPKNLQEGLARVQPLADADTSQAIDDLRSAWLNAADDGERQIAEDALAGLVQFCDEVSRDSQCSAQRYLDLLAQAGVGEFDPLMGILRGCAAGNTIMAPEVCAQAETRLAEQQRRGAAADLQEVLRELGYRTTTVADAMFVDGGSVWLTRDDWSDHAVVARFDAGSQELEFRMVRTESGAIDDAVMDGWCCGEGGVSGVLSRWRNRRGQDDGFRVREIAHPRVRVDPGSVPAEVRPIRAVGGARPAARALNIPEEGNQ